MRTDDFDFHLPPELIAQEPVEPRDASRLMVLRRSARTIEHHRFRDLPDLLDEGDVIVRNDTRVMAARLHGVREDTGGRVEVLLLRALGDHVWETFMRPARQGVEGRRFRFESTAGPITATALSRSDEVVHLRFDQEFDPATVGEVPLPPYITGYHGDPERYQTIYSQDARSAAAPTAGLHFTPRLVERMQRQGHEFVDLTLDVGPGTFQPVKVDDPRKHALHAEHVALSESAAARITMAKAQGRRIVAVGTTVVRTLEHVAREHGKIEASSGWTSLKLLPGDHFFVVDALITNFHLPRSTLLMLVSAFAGTEFVLEAYATAVAEHYRFYSFGDAMLILP